MNFGSTHATGDVLVFLHADCWLEPGALQDAERCLCGPGVIAGCFQMKVQANALVYRVIDAAATARVRLIGVAYGDQGLFLRKDTFDRLGGFPRLRFMEDLLARAPLQGVVEEEGRGSETETEYDREDQAELCQQAHARPPRPIR